MNCEAFEALIVELSRNGAAIENGQPLALAHAESCRRCAARLQDETALSAALHLAAADLSEASAHVEQALISAYRKQHAKTPLHLSPRPAIHALPAWMWAVAAALVVALAGAVIFRMIFWAQPDGSRIAAGTGQAPTQAASVRVGKKSATAATAVEDARDPAPVKAASAVKRIGSPPRTAQRNLIEEEIASDFIRLTSDTALSAMESGQLVRVLLPRSALASFGLPINQELMNEPVTAQVLIGQDGVARAIRFLSKTGTNYVQTRMQSKHQDQQ